MLFAIQFAVVLLCILIGAQVGGIGLGVFGGIGLAVMAFGFHIQPTSPPIDVMLMIMAVVSAAAAMQAAGGLDYLVRLVAGTGHVAYSVLPVIAEVSRRNGIRPERPLSMAVIASQFAIVASPVAAAVVSVVHYLEPQHITLIDVLKVTVPSTILGIGLACVFVNRMGKELADDPGYQQRLKDPEYVKLNAVEAVAEDAPLKPTAKTSVRIFLVAALLVVLMGAVKGLRPVFGGEHMGMAHTIEIVMLSAAALIILVCKPDGNEITQGSVFHAGMRAVIAVFGVAWMGDTLMQAHLPELKAAVSSLVETAPWTFAFSLFVLSVLVNSQGATVATLFPVGIALGVPAPILIGTLVAVNGYFFIPNYGPIIASIDFDTTGTTRIGRYIFNHSFMLPGLLSMAFSLALGLLFAQMFF